MFDADTGRWEGLDELPAELVAELRGTAENAVVDAADFFVANLKRTLSGERSGRPYKVSQRGPLHIASRPGEPPAVLFGHLRNSVGRGDPKWSDGVEVSIEVGVGLGVQQSGEVAENYAARLEFGGTDSRGVYIAPRPYMEPTYLAVQGPIEALFAERLGT